LLLSAHDRGRCEWFFCDGYNDSASLMTCCMVECGIDLAFIKICEIFVGWDLLVSSRHWVSIPISQSHMPQVASTSVHYAAGAMGAMSLRISELCLSFSPHPNISDGNVNLVHHLFCIQIFHINEKGSSWAWIRWRRRREWK